MKIKLIFFCLLLFTSILVKAQSWSVGGGYQYLYSQKWDKAIQTYNFSRPFLKEKQPLLVHGTYLELNYLFSSEKKIQSGIKLEHSFVRSRADNANFNVALQLQQIKLGYNLHYSFRNKLAGAFIEISPSAYGIRLSRRVNEELDEVDDENNVAFGIGGSLDLTVLYKVGFNQKFIFLPFLGIGYSPYLFSPKSEAVLNQTVTEKTIQVFSWKVGVRLKLSK